MAYIHIDPECTMSTLTATPTSSPMSPIGPVMIAPRSSPMTKPASSPNRPLPPKPVDPLAWLWQCHQCHRTYRLAVTRRCLDDGHYFCAGTTIVNKRGQAPRVKRHKACASEFDYAGWKAVGNWRRAVAENGGKENATPDVAKSAVKKDCWKTCDYPSQCRWGERIEVVERKDSLSPVVEVAELIETDSDTPSKPETISSIDGTKSVTLVQSQKSKFQELMDDVNIVPATAEASARQVLPTTPLEEIEIEVGKSLRKVGEMATEMMEQLQLRYPTLKAKEDRKRSRRKWRRKKPGLESIVVC